MSNKPAWTAKFHLAELYLNLETCIAKAKKRNRISKVDLDTLLTELLKNSDKIKL